MDPPVPAPPPALLPCIPRGTLTSRSTSGVPGVTLLPRTLHRPAGDCSGSVPALRGEGSSGCWGPWRSCRRTLAMLRCAPRTAREPPALPRYPAALPLSIPRKVSLSSSPQVPPGGQSPRPSPPAGSAPETQLLLLSPASTGRESEEKEKGKAKDGKHTRPPPSRP